MQIKQTSSHGLIIMENGEMARFDIKINLSVRKVEQLNTTDPSNRGYSRCKVSELSNIQ